MKLSRKAIAAISTAAALAMAGTFFGCKNDDEDPHELIDVDGDNASIDKSNGGEATASSDKKVATDNTFIRGFRTPNTSGWKGAVYKLTINEESKGGSVLGFVFDENKVEGANGAENTYSFYLLGVRATAGAPSIYLSRFEDVQQSGLSGAGTSFGTEYTMIDSGKTDSSQADSGSKYYYKLGTDNNGFPYVSGVATLYVAFKQTAANKGYSFGLFNGETDAKTWFNGGGETPTGADDKNVLRTGTVGLNAVNDTTFISHFQKTVGTTTYTPALDDFNVEYPKTAFRDQQVGFYAMIPSGGTLKGSWTKIDNKLADEVVVE